MTDIGDSFGIGRACLYSLARCGLLEHFTSLVCPVTDQISQVHENQVEGGDNDQSDGGSEEHAESQTDGHYLTQSRGHQTLSRFVNLVQAAIVE